MKVESYLREKIAKNGAALAVLIDPVEQTPDKAAKMALAAQEAGSDIIQVGGSIAAGNWILEECCKAIKQAINIPLVLFPGNVNGITRYADAVYFMSLINSEDPYWVSEAQTLMAPFVKYLGIEPIPTTYIILEPGGAVSWVGKARPVPRNQPEIAVACALAGKYLGSHIIITDSGSGVPEPAPSALISAVKEAIGDTIYLYGGGIKTPEHVKQVISAGADMIQIGTAFEKAADPKAFLRKIIEAAREAGKKK